MRQLLLTITFFTIAFVVLGFLMWNYSQFYAVIGQKHLPSPNTQPVYELGKTTQPPLVYVALGDSLTAGVGAQNYQNTYPYLLAEKLSQTNHVYLYNLGQPGARVPDLLDFQLRKTITLKPQLITIFIGTNDLQNFTDLTIYRRSYQAIISNLKAQTSARIVILTIPYLASEQYIYPPWNKLLHWQTNRYNKVVTQLCQQNQLTCLDLYQFSKQPFSANPDLYASDHFHPSDAGYILWGKFINEHFTP